MNRDLSLFLQMAEMCRVLLYHYLQQGLQTQMVMESPIKERNVIDIQATIEKHESIIPTMLVAHALTGCYTVSVFHSVGKGTMLKVLKSVSTLNVLGNVDDAWSDVMEQTIQFMAACYGQPKSNSV